MSERSSTLVRQCNSWVFGGVARAALILGSAGFAEEAAQQGPNALPPQEKLDAQSSQATEGTERLLLGHKLVVYGRQHQFPEALIVAAEILRSVTTEKAEEEPVTQKKPDAPADTEVETIELADNSPQALLAEARAMSNAPHIVAMADAAADRLTENPRGSCDRARTIRGHLGAHQTDVYSITFHGGEPAMVCVHGACDSEFHVSVYDENGNFINCAHMTGHHATVRWNPRWTGVFTVQIENEGHHCADYELWHN